MRHGVIQDRGPGGYRLRTEFRASIQRKATGCIHDRLLVMEDRAMLHIFNFKREATKQVIICKKIPQKPEYYFHSNDKIIRRKWYKELNIKYFLFHQFLNIQISKIYIQYLTGQFPRIAVSEILSRRSCSSRVNHTNI